MSVGSTTLHMEGARGLLAVSTAAPGMHCQLSMNAGGHSTSRTAAEDRTLASASASAGFLKGRRRRHEARASRRVVQAAGTWWLSAAHVHNQRQWKSNNQSSFSETCMMEVSMHSGFSWREEVGHLQAHHEACLVWSSAQVSHISRFSFDVKHTVETA